VVAFVPFLINNLFSYKQFCKPPQNYDIYP